jgi:DNA-binding SARP family transcriptional activator
MLNKIANLPEATWYFHLLGGIATYKNGEALPVPPQRTHSLLAALLLMARPLNRIYLCGLLYPDSSEEYGKKRISDLLWLLRRVLPDIPIETSDQFIYLPAEARWLDVESFEAAQKTSDPSAWRQAIELYRGDRLAGNYDEWLLVRRENFRLVYTSLLRQLATLLFRQKDYTKALPYLEILLQIEPLDEDALYMLMAARGETGQRGAALAAYEKYQIECQEAGLQVDGKLSQLAESLHWAYAPTCATTETIQGDETPLQLLEIGRRALLHGDRWTVQTCLDKLGSLATLEKSLEFNLLEIDSGLEFLECDKAETLLKQLDPEDVRIRLRLARLAKENKQDEQAKRMATDVLVQSENSPDKELQIAALLILANAKRRLGEGPEAMMVLEKALQLAQKIDSPFYIASVWLEQGLYFTRQGRYETAISVLNRAHALSKEANLHLQYARAMHRLAYLHSLTGKYSAALELSQAELAIWRDLDIPLKEAQAVDVLSLEYCQLGRTGEALQALYHAQEILQTLGDRSGAAQNLYHIASTIPYHSEAQVDQAIRYAKLALESFKEQNQAGWEAATLATLGYCFWIAGDYHESLHASQEAYRLHHRLGEMGVLPELLGYQALALLGLGQLDEALECSRQALLAMAGAALENDIIAEIYYAHAAVLETRQEENEAARYYELAYQNLLECAETIQEEQARQVFFRRDPTVRRLMAAVYARHLAPRPGSVIIHRSLSPHNASQGQPGQVNLTLDAGPSDLVLMRTQGAITLRRAKLKRLQEEARKQGVSLRIDELAELLNVSPRTIKRDLASLRAS